MVDVGASVATPGYPDSTAVGVNDAATAIVFNFKNGGGDHGRAVVWAAAGGAVDLGNLGGDFTYPTAINDQAGSSVAARLPRARRTRSSGGREAA